MNGEPLRTAENPEPKATAAPQAVNLLGLGVVLAILGLIIITATTFQFDLVKDHVFKAHPDFAPYVAAVGYVCAIGGLLLALVHFIREG